MRDRSRFRIILFVFVTLVAPSVWTCNEDSNAMAQSDMPGAIHLLNFAQNRTSASRPSPPPPPPYMRDAKSYEETTRGTRIVFHDGLTVLIHEYRTQPLVSLQAYIPGGFSADPEDARGLAAMTASMRVGVGRNSPGGTVLRKAQALGGVLRSQTEARYSMFEVTAPSSRWKQALRLQSEALLDPFADMDWLRQSIDTFAENLHDMLTEPIVHAERELTGLLFGPRFQALVARENITPEKIIEFHKKHYVPSAVTLIVAGDVNAGDVINEIHQIYVSKTDTSKTGNAKTEVVSVPASTGRAAVPSDAKSSGVLEGFRYRTVAGHVVSPRLFFGFPVTVENQADYRALEVVAAMLSFGESSVLNTRLRDQKGLVATAHAKLDFSTGNGLFSIALETEPQNIDKSELALWTEMEILKRNGPSAVDLARAVAQLERVWWEGLETVEGRGRVLARGELQGDWKYLERYQSETGKITAADVRRVMEKYLTMRNWALVEYLPRTMADRKLTADVVGKTMEILLPASVKEELADRAFDVAPDYKIPADALVFRGNEIRHSFQTASVLRGPEIYIREDHSSPFLEMGFFFPGGKSLETEANYGITQLMLEMMLADDKAICQLEIYGGRLEPINADNHFGFRLSVPSRYFSAGLDLIKKAVKTPDFKKAKSALPGNLSVADVQSWHEKNVRNLKPLAVIVGDVQGTAPASFFVEEFSGSRMRDGKITTVPSKPMGKSALRDHNGRDRQSAVRLEFQAPTSGDVDACGVYVLENYLGETGWLAEEIRDHKAVAYRMACEYHPQRNSGNFVVTALMKAGEEARGLTVIQEEISRLLTQPLPYADFQAALAGAAGIYVIRNQTRWAQIEKLTENLLAGLGLEEYRNFSRNIADTSEDSFRNLMRRILDMDKAVTVTIHGGN